MERRRRGERDGETQRDRGVETRTHRRCSAWEGHRALDPPSTPGPPQAQGPLGSLWPLAWLASGMAMPSPKPRPRYHVSPLEARLRPDASTRRHTHTWAHMHATGTLTNTFWKDSLKGTQGRIHHRVRPGAQALALRHWSARWIGPCCLAFWTSVQPSPTKCVLRYLVPRKLG